MPSHFDDDRVIAPDSHVLAWESDRLNHHYAFPPINFFNRASSDTGIKIGEVFPGNNPLRRALIFPDFTRQQASAWLEASPYDYKFLETNTKLNRRDYPVLIIYYDDREELIESTPLPTGIGEILEGYFMEGYCFVEVEKNNS